MMPGNGDNVRNQNSKIVIWDSYFFRFSEIWIWNSGMFDELHTEFPHENIFLNIKLIFIVKINNSSVFICYNRCIFMLLMQSKWKYSTSRCYLNIIPKYVLKKVIVSNIFLSSPNLLYTWKSRCSFCLMIWEISQAKFKVK